MKSFLHNQFSCSLMPKFGSYLVTIERRGQKLQFTSETQKEGLTRVFEIL